MPGESYGIRLLRFWVPSWWGFGWMLLGLLPLFFFETFVHEGLHWLTGIAHGDHPTLIPFAHLNRSLGIVNGATMDGGGFIATPQIVCYILLVALIVVFVFASPPWRWLRTFLTWWYLGLVIDLLYNTLIGAFGVFHDKADWGKFAASSGEGVAIFLSWLILLTVLSQLGWIAASRWHVNRPEGAGFFEFRGLAIAYGLLSLIAVILSLAIQHPAIVRNWWFWLIWSAQLASLLWYIAYIVWASVQESRQSA